MVKYFTITFALSWASFIAASLLSHSACAVSPDTMALQELLTLLGTFSPGIVALWMKSQGRNPGEPSLLARVVKWNVNIELYAFALGYMVIIKLLVAVTHLVITGSWPAFGTEPWYIMLLAIPFSTVAQAGEELGWRGFALPRMTVQFGLPVATLMLGAIWAIWHLPFFYLQWADKSGQSFPLYLLQVTALSVVLGWLYWRAQGSLLLVMLMHAAVNNTKDIVPSTVSNADIVFALSHSLPAWLTVILLWVSAIYFLVQMKGVRNIP